MHASRYFSISPTERDQIFYDWWRALGAKDFDNATPVTGDDQPITDEELLKSLQYLLGIPNASFREDQLEACRHVANSKTQNAIVGLDCGAGKSMTFTLPLYAKYRYGKIDGITIVICSHRAELNQHFVTASDQLKNTDVQFGMFTAGDIDDDFTLAKMEEFDLIFLSLNAWSRIVTDKLIGIILELKKKNGVSHVIFDEYHMLYEENSIRKMEYLSSRHLLSTGAPITILTATLPNPFRIPVMQFLDIEDSAIEIGMGKCDRPDVELNIHLVSTSALIVEAVDRIENRLLSNPNGGTIHCISYFKNEAELISSCLTGKNIENTLLTGGSESAVFKKVSQDHREAKIQVLVSTFGTALDGPKVDYVCIAGGAWSMNTLVQNIGRIRSQSQGENALVDVLYASDRNEKLLSKMEADAMKSAIELKNENNGLVLSEDDYLEHCSIVGVNKYIQMSGCRMVNAYRRYGGSNEVCGRCDNCRGGCAHTAASHRRTQALIQNHDYRMKCRSFFQSLQSVCSICSKAECDGHDEERCNGTKDACFLCGWRGHWTNHRRATCAAQERQYTSTHYCNWCLSPKIDTGGVEHHGGTPNKCKMKKRLHRFFRYCFRKKFGNVSDNGESYLKFMNDIFANDETYYRRIVELTEENNIKY